MIEGESLVNDAVALIVYRYAVAAVVAGSFSLGSAMLAFLAAAAGGIAIGVAVGWVVKHLRRRMHDASAEIALSLLAPYVAYLPAEAAGASAVLAAVTVGVYLGWYSPGFATPGNRIQSFAVWDMVSFGLNAALFVLIGLQLRPVFDELGDRSAGTLILYAVAIAAAVMLVRLAWVLAFYVPRRLRAGRRKPRGPARAGGAESLVVAWTGIRGAVSLAAALALPLEVHGGGAFPQRALIVFLVLGVIVATLLLQGLSLPALIRRLGIAGDASLAEEELRARTAASGAALEALDELDGETGYRRTSPSGCATATRSASVTSRIAPRRTRTSASTAASPSRRRGEEARLRRPVV